ncbi:UDP-glucose pyrophosphorylase 2b isoform X1, partial [Tachysurus ichikawai]
MLRLTPRFDVIAGVSTSEPPDSFMAQFQEVMRQQLESSMHAELEKLLSTAKGADAE